MDVLVLIDKLDDTVHNAKPVPLTDQVRVDKEEIYDILDQMRATIPEEIKQARWIIFFDFRLAPGESATHTFDRAGEYFFNDCFSPRPTGKVEVVPQP